MTTTKNPNIFPVDIDPIEEVLEHVYQLSLRSQPLSHVEFVEHALEQFEAFEVPLSPDALSRVMDCLFESPRYAAADHASLTPPELTILYPGITSQLLTWYVTLAKVGSS